VLRNPLMNAADVSCHEQLKCETKIQQLLTAFRRLSIRRNNNYLTLLCPYQL
jgi:hypothetical protein